MTARQSPGRADLAGALARELRGQLVAGAAFRGELEEGDLVLEVSVRVRRAVTREAAREYLAQALAELETNLWRSRCQCDGRRAPYSKFRHQCTKRATHAVVYRRWSGKKTSFAFVCNSHRDRSGIDGSVVLAVVPLPAAAVRAAAVRRQELQDQVCREDSEVQK